MKRLVIRSAFCLALCTGVALSSVAPAVADGSPSSATHREAHSADSSFRAKWRAWVVKRQAIATDFRAAVASARSTFETAKAQAVTSADRYAATTAFVAAIALAAENRSAALIALGPAPTNPNRTSQAGTRTRRTRVGVSLKNNHPHHKFRFN